MRRIFIATLVIAMMLVGQALASRVTHVDLSYQNGATVARIYVDGPIRFTHSTEIPKDGRPDRVIVDILTATHEMGAKEFHNLPPCVITAVRSSQYAVNPEQIVRVVFDLSEAPVYRIDADLASVSITFDNKGTKPFTTWSSASSVAVPQPAPSAPQAKTMAQPSTPPVTVAAKNQAIEKDRQASLSDVPKAGRSAGPAAKPTENKSAAASKPSTAPASKTAPHSAFGNYSELQPRVATAPTKNPEATKPTGTRAESPAVKPDIAKPAETPAAVKPTTSKPTPADQKPAPKTDAVKPDVSSKATPTRVNDKPAPSPVPEASTKTTLAEASEKPAPSPAKPSAKSASEPVKITEVAAKDNENQEQSASKKSTSRFRREATSAKIKGTMIAEFPQRLVVKYESRGQRDPFASLVDDDRYSNNPIETRIPNIEGLKLVGIIASGEQANRALFEDNSGYSYMLKSGDKVRNGYVLRVEVDQVFFQIFEYGWSRTVALKMD